jgi:3D (Asp-Asp-Asp) domain-containing protein
MIIAIRQGDAATITEEISGLSSLSGYTAKMYITKKDGTAIKTVTGTAASLTVTYQLLNDDTKVFPVGSHKYETKLFDASDHVYTPSADTFLVEAAIEEDPS